jgi:CTP synthase (UTP-ammonia lyase)
MLARPRVALIADFDPSFPPHPATEEAVRHAAVAQEVEADLVWVGTKELEPNAAARLTGFAGVWVAPGSPYQSLAGGLAAIRYARESDLPLLGTCGGFQHVVLEYARNVLGIANANHAEYDPYASRLFISRLACSLVGQTMEVRLARGSRAAEAYGSLAAVEQYYCNFGINPEVVGELFGNAAMPTANVSSSASTPTPAWDVAPGSDRTLTISGTDQDGEPRVIELAGHRFFLATLYVPQMRSRPGQPHPLVMAWLRAATRGRGG